MPSWVLVCRSMLLLGNIFLYWGGVHVLVCCWVFFYWAQGMLGFDGYLVYFFMVFFLCELWFGDLWLVLYLCVSLLPLWWWFWGFDFPTLCTCCIYQWTIFVLFCLSFVKVHLMICMVRFGVGSSSRPFFFFCSQVSLLLFWHRVQLELE